VYSPRRFMVEKEPGNLLDLPVPKYKYWRRRRCGFQQHHADLRVHPSSIVMRRTMQTLMSHHLKSLFVTSAALLSMYVCVCVWVCACVRACVRACVYVRARLRGACVICCVRCIAVDVRVRVCVCVRARATYIYTHGHRATATIKRNLPHVGRKRQAYTFPSPT
jgi:hypothetical protein